MNAFSAQLLEPHLRRALAYARLPFPLGIGESMARAKRIVRKHSVSASVQIHELTKAGTSIDFEIFSGAEKIGTIVIGRGSLTWFGRNRRKAIELNWTRFAKLMDEQYG